MADKVAPPPSHTHLTEGKDNNTTERTWNTWFSSMHATLDQRGLMEPPESGIVPVVGWGNTWQQGRTYKTGTIVIDDGWLMIANKDTTSKPAPAPVGDTEYELGTNPGFSTESFTGVVQTGHEYTTQKGGWVARVQVWVPEVGNGIEYNLITIDPATNTTTKTLITSQLTAGQWSNVRFGSKVIPVGRNFAIILDALNSGSSTEVTGGWSRQGNSNTAAPTTGGWNRRQQDNVVRIHHTDLDSVGRQTELESIIPGSTIEFVSTANPSQAVTYDVASTTPLASYVEYGVNRVGDGSSGEPPVGTDCIMTATVPVPKSTEYAELSGEWPAQYPTFAAIKGIKFLNGVEQPVDNNAYGVRIEFQEAYVSGDWDLMAYTQF